jgi:hypothetical protein
MFMAEFEEWWQNELAINQTDESDLSPLLKKVCYKAYLTGRVDENVDCQTACLDTLHNEDKAAFKNYEDNHVDGWTDGCNECHWAIAARMQDLQ